MNMKFLWNLFKSKTVKSENKVVPIQEKIVHTPTLTLRKINHLIATEMLGWAYSRGSDTYWLEMGCCLGTAASFNPITDEYQGKKVIETLKLPCTFENLKEYVLSLTPDQMEEMRKKYGLIQRTEVGIKYYTVSSSGELERLK